MKRTWLVLFSLALVLPAMTISASAQENSEGTINTLSVNPRQNAELGNYTGTQSGQPSDSVPGSERQPNGLIPSIAPASGTGDTGSTQRVPPSGSNGPAYARSEANPNNNSPNAKTPGAKPKVQSK